MLNRDLAKKPATMRVALIVLSLILFTFGVSGCTNLNTDDRAVEIDWVNFVVFNNIHYMDNYQGNNKYDQDGVDGVIGEITFNVSKVKDPAYKAKNGDAAYLPVGTKIYKIKGYKPEFRIAASIGGEWRIYEADTNPGAKKGEDLLDIRDKVSYIGINSETDGTTELGAIKDKAIINNLVGMVLNAAVDQNRQDQAGERYFISFHLLDGTDVTRSYWIGTGELSRGMMLPSEFGVEVKKAISSYGASTTVTPSSGPSITTTPNNETTTMNTDNSLVADLNGDGKKETISADFAGDVCIIKMNDKSLRVDGSSFLPKIYLVDINKKDKIKEIAISEEGPSGDYKTYFFAFDGNIKEMGEIQGYYEGQKHKKNRAIRINGDNIVHGISRGTYFQTWFFYDVYDLTEIHTLAQRPQELYKAVWTNELTAKTEIKCFGNDKRTVRAVLHKGEKVVFIGSDEKTYCLIKLNNGKYYWIKGDIYGTELFDGANNAD